MSLNIAVLMGRPTTDIELKHTPNDISVCSFTLAVDRTYVKAGADREADFIQICCWRNTADFCSKYVHKGQLVAVQGSIQTRSYTDKDGNKRKVFEIVADNVHFAEPKRDNNTSSQGNYPVQQNSTPDADYSTGNDDFEEIPTDDDLPFK